MTPNTGPFDLELITQSMIAALDVSGPAVLVTHSQGGMPGWSIASETDNVTGVIAIEPGNFVIPEPELPEPISSISAFAIDGKIGFVPVPMKQFQRLIQKPITIYFGD